MKTMSKKDFFAMILLGVGLIFFYLGITKPILSVVISTPPFPIVGSIEILNETRSIISTISFLYDSKNIFVAGLILAFSIVLPITKIIATLIKLLVFPNKKDSLLDFIIAFITKWAMADVFAVAIMIVFLSVSKTQGAQSNVEIGFYYFTTYVFLSIVGTQIYYWPKFTQKL